LGRARVIGEIEGESNLSLYVEIERESEREGRARAMGEIEGESREGRRDGGRK
jgi:hypothetical protein